MAAVFSDAERGGGNAVYDEKGGAAAGVAVDCFRSVDGRLV